MGNLTGGKAKTPGAGNRSLRHGGIMHRKKATA